MLTCKSPRKVMRAAFFLARDALPKYSSKFSRHDFTMPQLFACLIVKEHQRKSYRQAEALLGDSWPWCRDIVIGRVGAPTVEISPKTRVAGPFSLANAAFSLANATFSLANASISITNAAFSLANDSIALANAAFALAEGAFCNANDSFAWAKAAFALENGAFAPADRSFAHADARLAGSIEHSRVAD